MAKVGVALSGGGHRASLFGLGALMYLADAEVNHDVTAIASVSGGSLTNAFVAQSVSFGDVNGAEFEVAVVKPLASQLAQRGSLFAGWQTKGYVLLLVLAFAGAIAVWWIPWPWWARLIVFLAALLVWAKLAEQRGRVCEAAFARTLLHRNGRPTLLREVHNGVDHVLCATDLHAGEHVYFSPGFMCAYRFGWGAPGDLPLARAAQCSAALPGAFPVRWLRTAQFGFTGGTDSAATMALVDGGVYDNMADQWGQGMDGRVARWPGHAADMRQMEELVVVNSSAGLRFGGVASLRWPLIGELLSLLRDKDVLYDNGTSLRRFGLVGRFDRAELTNRGLRGALVHIPDSPFTVPQAFATSTDWPDRAARADDVLKRFAAAGESEAEWAAIADADRAVKTTLSKMGGPVAARLLRHGYLLAMANLHVLLGHPLLDMPPKARFDALVS